MKTQKTKLCSRLSCLYIFGVSLFLFIGFNLSLPNLKDMSLWISFTICAMGEMMILFTLYSVLRHFGAHEIWKVFSLLQKVQDTSWIYICGLSCYFLSLGSTVSRFRCFRIGGTFDRSDSSPDPHLLTCTELNQRAAPIRDSSSYVIVQKNNNKETFWLMLTKLRVW